MSRMNREYKSSIFTLLFSDKEKLMSLFSAISGEQIDSPDEITINTLTDENGYKNGIFTKMKNDLSFIIHDTQNMYEHQSTWSDNMPVRMLLYYAELLKKKHPLRSLYKSSSVNLATPTFIVFYNGESRKDAFEEMTLNLSSHFLRKEKKPSIELTVKVYNINEGHNKELMEACKTLSEYATFVEMSRNALKGARTADEKTRAMNEVLDKCVEQGILADFIREHKEVILMSNVLEFDEKLWEEAIREESFEDGFDQGYDKRLYDMIRDGVISLDKGASYLGVSAEELTSRMTAAEFKISESV